MTIRVTPSREYNMAAMDDMEHMSDSMEALDINETLISHGWCALTCRRGEKRGALDQASPNSLEGYTSVNLRQIADIKPKEANTAYRWKQMPGLCR